MGSVEWSGVSGVDSPGSVPGPPQRQRSQQGASCADVHYRVLVQWTPLLASLLKVLNNITPAPAYTRRESIFGLRAQLASSGGARRFPKICGPGGAGRIRG